MLSVGRENLMHDDRRTAGMGDNGMSVFFGLESFRAGINGQDSQYDNQGKQFLHGRDPFTFIQGKKTVQSIVFYSAENPNILQCPINCADCIEFDKIAGLNRTYFEERDFSGILLAGIIE
jgi:hypothetical protein